MGERARREGATASDIEQLPVRQEWPRGATSDDTALTLLVARHLADRDGDGDPGAFLADLADQAQAIRGLGPTTTAAIEHFRRGGEPAAAPARATNGAAMRALPIGWVLPHLSRSRSASAAVTAMLGRSLILSFLLLPDMATVTAICRCVSHEAP